MENETNKSGKDCNPPNDVGGSGNTPRASQEPRDDHSDRCSQCEFFARQQSKKEEIPCSDRPFYSCFLLCFFLGMFLHPLFYLIGIFGLCSTHLHKYWAGKASAIALSITLVIFALKILLAVVFILGAEYGRNQRTAFRNANEW